MADTQLASQAANAAANSLPSDSKSKDAELAQTSIDTTTEVVDSQVNGQALASSSTTVNGVDHQTQESQSQNNPLDAMESRIPLKKDATLREFLSKMDEHAPIVSSNLHLFDCF
jgi:transcription initiation factor TFIID subunit 10